MYNIYVGHFRVCPQIISAILILEDTGYKYGRKQLEYILQTSKHYHRVYCPINLP